MRLSLQSCRLLLLSMVLLLILSVTAARGAEGVTAEAIDHANVRSGPGVTYDTIGTIFSGTHYPVIGKSAHFPWLLISMNGGQGWVFTDLVKVTGSLSGVPFASDSTVGSMSSATPTIANSAQVASQPSATLPGATLLNAALTLSPSPTGMLIRTISPTLASNVYATSSDTLNIRYGPGTEFPRVGVMIAGQAYPVMRRHTQFKWIEIAYSGVAGGRGWVFLDAVKITGNLQSVPSTSATTFGYPTLTATQNMVVTVQPPWIASTVASVSTDGTGNNDPATTKLLTDIGNRVFDLLLTIKFEPGQARQASAFLMDLRSKQAITLNPGVSYSGMSLIKIPILLAVFRALDSPPTADQAELLGQMMICSNNDASNALLKLVGDGDVIAGSHAVTDMLTQIGLKNTFIVGPFEADPRATQAPLRTIKTQSDQVSTDPDPFNQVTPQDLGYLLSGIYQCALDGTGPLITALGTQLTMTECRQMIRLLSSDKIGVMIEAGVPDTIAVAHKHGWVDGALGDAGIVFTPGGDYVLIVLMHENKIIWPQEFPHVSEIARLVYNAYNPHQTLASIHPQNIPLTCTLDDALLRDLRADGLPPIR